MAEKILVDVNIFIDIQRRRQGWKKSIAVLGSVEKGIFEGYISALTTAIVYYLRLPVSARVDALHSANFLAKCEELGIKLECQVQRWSSSSRPGVQ